MAADREARDARALPQGLARTKKGGAGPAEAVDVAPALDEAFPGAGVGVVEALGVDDGDRPLGGAEVVAHPVGGGVTGVAAVDLGRPDEGHASEAVVADLGGRAVRVGAGEQ